MFLFPKFPLPSCPATCRTPCCGSGAGAASSTSCLLFLLGAFPGWVRWGRGRQGCAQGSPGGARRTSFSLHTCLTEVVCPSVHLSIHLSIQRTIHMSIYSSIHSPIRPASQPPAHSSIHPPVHTYIHLSIHPSSHLPIHPPVHPSLYPSAHPFTCLFVRQSMHPSFHLSTYPSIPSPAHQPFSPSILPFIYLFIHPSVHPSVCPSIHASIPPSWTPRALQRVWCHGRTLGHPGRVSRTTRAERTHLQTPHGHRWPWPLHMAPSPPRAPCGVPAGPGWEETTTAATPPEESGWRRSVQHPRGTKIAPVTTWAGCNFFIAWAHVTAVS